MAILDKIKYGIDLPTWRQVNPVAIHAAGVSWCADKKNDLSSYQVGFQLQSASVANVMFCPSNAWNLLCNPGLSGFGAGAACTLTYAMSYVGTIAAGCSTTKITTSTNNGTWATNGAIVSKGFGFRMRIIGNSAGSSGKVEERYIISNTGGTAPTFYLSSALSFTPASGDTYEIMAFKFYMLGTTAGATQLRVYRSGIGDVASAGNTTLTIATESELVALDEQLVPYNHKPGEGFLKGASTYDALYNSKGCLLATGSAAGTITGQASAGDASVLQNEYRNFQIRIVEDTAIPTAVNQRRIIASHTAGASPVYTLGSNWSVTPSTDAKFVIENPNIIILFTVAAGTTTYTYNPTAYTINNGTANITTGAFSTTYIGARGTVIAAGSTAFPSYGHQPITQTDGTRNSRHSYVWSFRGGSSALDLLDISGAAAGAWTNSVVYNNGGVSLTTGTSGEYSPTDQHGRWGYMVIGATSAMYRFDVEGIGLYPWVHMPAQAGTAAVGKRVFVVGYQDGAVGGTDKMGIVFAQSHLSTAMYRTEVVI